MPLARARRRRARVVEPRPVARTAATVGTVAVVAHGVHRRSDRREDRRDDRYDRRDDRRDPSLLSRRHEAPHRVCLRSRRVAVGVRTLPV